MVKIKGASAKVCMDLGAIFMQISILWHAHLAQTKSMPTADQMNGLSGDDYMIVAVHVEHSNMGFALVISKQRSQVVLCKVHT